LHRIYKGEFVIYLLKNICWGYRVKDSTVFVVNSRKPKESNELRG
jgi:hypothetical protein